MKNISKLFLCAGLLFLNTGCETDDFLDKVNPNALNADSFWKDADQVGQGLIATYAALQFQGVMGATATTELPVRSDLGRPNNWNANARSLNTLTFNDNTGVVKQKWDSAYEGVYRANQVLEHLGVIQDVEQRQTVEAQARFLRGFFYYILYQGYNGGSVILHTSTPKVKEDFSKSPAPKEDVFQLILEDFEYAEAHLPKTWNANNVGRATWGAASAMLGKLWINEGEYEKAKGYFKAVIDRPDLYSLTPDIGWNFDEEHEFNAESIFEVPFSATAKSGNIYGANDGPIGSEGTNRNYTLGSTTGGGFRVIMPSYWVTMLFKEDPMDPTDPRYEADDVYSLRTSASIAIANDLGSTLYQKPSDKGGEYNNREASYLKKYQNWKMEREPLTMNSGINERVIRLAEVYLLYAETLLQTGGSVSEALALVNQIRDRAGVVELEAAAYDATALMEHIMWVEQPLELMFEGHDLRWESLRRWGKIKEQYSRLAAMKFTLDGQNIRWYQPGDEGKFFVVQEFVEAAQDYNPALHDYFPIPVTEQLTNPNL
ncbi:RagB/SusD family nutrient uptake outer membrane protein [Pontibacter sp. E15-1]|uniref:RagB/SusD family nutrient uptake outer membrane protein n=1 Tax=Pontibacter sp. E15-1 TaxID=2919918 RepID=UPI001F4F9E8E|nr:RagB/SusD family nutrient uptake outer membrane protein [Pontibacter sp. E15-1]MCJ8163283.1 RagB/SusD family nutrient uptake outer membrane protein [Pontibacter sp. E15-1]